MHKNKEFAEALLHRQNLANGSIWASDIFEGQIWLGAGRDAANLDRLVHHGITHILNCADDVDNFHKKSDLFVYKQLFVADFGGDEGISRVFADAFSFVDSAIGSCGIHNSCNDNIEEDCSTSFRRNNPSVGLQQPTSNRVLIHCANGSNRSATVTMALMMHRQDWDLCTAWNFVTAKRPQVAPLRDNRKELLAFELSVNNHKKRVVVLAGTSCGGDERGSNSSSDNTASRQASSSTTTTATACYSQSNQGELTPTGVSENTTVGSSNSNSDFNRNSMRRRMPDWYPYRH